MLFGPTHAYALGGIPVNAALPSMSGTPKPGNTLTASPGAWTEEPTEFKYQWERCNKVDGICVSRWQGSESQSYVVVPNDVGNTLRVQVTAANAAGESAPVTSSSIEVERAWHFVPGPPRVEVARWGVGLTRQSEPFVKSKALTIGVFSGFCLGEPKPVIDHISVVERPRTAERPFKSAVVTAFVRFPAPTEVVGTVNKGEPVPACAGLGYGLRHRIKFKRPVRDLFVFDGSHTPPRRVLRPPRARQGSSVSQPGQ